MSPEPESNWDVDQRFRELILAEFGDVAGARDPDDVDPPPLAPPPVRRFRPAKKLPDPIEYFNLTDEIERATPDEDFERWNPPVGKTFGPLPARAIVGIVLLVATVALGIAVLAGFASGLPVGIIALASAGIGIGLLLSTLPRHRDVDGDGAQL